MVGTRAVKIVISKALDHVSGIISVISAYLTSKYKWWKLYLVEGSIWKIYKRVLFLIKNYKRTPLILATPLSIAYLATLLVIKHIFDKNKSLKAASWNQMHFWPRITLGGCFFIYLSVFKCLYQKNSTRNNLLWSKWVNS